MTSERQHIDIIQVYRAIAALAVIFYHYSWFVSPLEQTLLRRGYLGVDIFFMVSGFLVWITTRQLQSGWKNSLKYIIRRSFRIFPAYAILTSGYAIYYWFTRPASGLFNQTIKSLFFIPLNGGESPAYGFPLLENGWTLNYEFFYLMVAVMLLCGRSRYLFLVILFLSLMLLVPRDALLQRQASDPHFYQQYILMISDSINIDFLAGLLAAMLYSRMSSSAGIGCWLLMAGSVVFFLFAVGGLYAPFGERWNLHTNVMTLPCFILFLSGLKLSKITSRRVPGWLMFTGKISYSLYLLHMAVIFTVISAAQRYLGEDYFDSFSNRFNLLWVSLVLTYICSWVFYLFVEIKLSVFLRDKLLKRLPL